MSAGTCISHSEYNASKTEPVHFLQIWIIPNQTGLKPGYEQRSLDLKRKAGSWILVASPDARDGSVKVHQDTELSLASLPKEARFDYRLKTGRRGWFESSREDIERALPALRLPHEAKTRAVAIDGSGIQAGE